MNRVRLSRKITRLRWDDTQKRNTTWSVLLGAEVRQLGAGGLADRFEKFGWQTCF